MNESVYQLGQRRQFFLLDEPKFLHKVDEVFEGSVEMRFLLKTNHLGKVDVVNVGVNAEETLEENRRGNAKKVWVN